MGVEGVQGHGSGFAVLLDYLVQIGFDQVTQAFLALWPTPGIAGPAWLELAVLGWPAVADVVVLGILLRAIFGVIRDVSHGVILGLVRHHVGKDAEFLDDRVRS